MNLLYGIGIILFIVIIFYFLTYNKAEIDQPEKKEEREEQEKQEKQEKEHKIEIIGYKFKPNELIIKKGEAVIFIAKENSHNIIFRDNEKYNHEEKLKKGEEHKVIFEEIGEYKYYCRPHPGMKGIIIVE